MDIAITEAGAALADLVRRAEAGEDVVLTRDGRRAVRLQPLEAQRPAQPTSLTVEQRRRVIEKAIEQARASLLPGPDAAHSQDFLYDEDGLPA